MFDRLVKSRCNIKGKIFKPASSSLSRRGEGCIEYRKGRGNKKGLTGLLDMTRIVIKFIGGFTYNEDSGGVGA